MCFIKEPNTFSILFSCLEEIIDDATRNNFNTVIEFMKQNGFEFMSRIISSVIKFYNSTRVKSAIKLLRYLIIASPEEFNIYFEKVLEQLPTVPMKLKQRLISYEPYYCSNKVYLKIKGNGSYSNQQSSFISDLETFFDICRETI